MMGRRIKIFSQYGVENFEFLKKFCKNNIMKKINGYLTNLFCYFISTEISKKNSEMYR